MKIFDFKKNLFIGILIGIIFALAWFVLQGTLNFLKVWNVAEGLKPYQIIADRAGLFEPLVLSVLKIALTVFILYFVSLIFRTTGLFIASDLNRARTCTRIAKKLKIMFVWRFTIGLALFTDALEGLQFVRIEEYNENRSLGLITGIQRVINRRTKRSRYEFRVYFGDFPTFVLGRWKWIGINRCEKIVTDAGQLIPVFFTAGFAGPRDLIIDTWELEDIRLITQKLKEREALLVAAGLADPDYPLNGNDLATVS